MIKKLQNIREQKSDQGFTIIEVMIVLAIAGLILLIVFLAIPALQRNSRNTQRKNDASKVASLISEYESNNNGSTPQGVAFVTPTANYVDATAEKFSILDNSANVTAVTNTGAAITAPTLDKVVVVASATCNGNVPSSTVASKRSLVVYYYLEGSTSTGCIQS